MNNIVPILFITIFLTIILVVFQLILATKFEFVQAPFLALTLRSLFASFILAIVVHLTIGRMILKHRQY
jgi:hypothetical protein